MVVHFTARQMELTPAQRPVKNLREWLSCPGIRGRISWAEATGKF